MRYRLYFVLQLCAVVLLVTLVAVGVAWQWIAVAAVLVAVVFVLAYRSVLLPLKTIQNGIYLLREQDFSSRLRGVGQKDADNVVGMFNTMMDSLKNERLKNLEQNAFLARLIAASPMGIAICDFDGNVRETNPAYDALASADVVAALASLPEGGSTVVRSGHSQICRCSRSSFMDSGFSRPFFLVELMTDEIAKAETEMFNKIVRTMGHEVNNTLGSVISVLETIEDMHADDPMVAGVARSCGDSCRNLGLFVKGYSDVVKLPEPTLARVDLNVWVTDTMPVLQGLASNNIQIVSELCDGEAFAQFDSMLMERVLVNIVKNAVESIGDDDGGRIVVRVAPGMLQVVDNGKGISREAAAKIFTPFFSTKRQDRGLGLMLIADILRKHNAAFDLATDDDGLTRFTIRFA